MTAPRPQALASAREKLSAYLAHRIGYADSFAALGTDSKLTDQVTIGDLRALLHALDAEQPAAATPVFPPLTHTMIARGCLDAAIGAVLEGCAPEVIAAVDHLSNAVRCVCDAIEAQARPAASEADHGTVVYLAHPLSGDVEANRRNAARWAAWAVVHMGVAVECSWVVLTGVLDDSDPATRALGLQLDCALIERCDEIWLTGSRVSPGMQLEADHARKWGKPVRDFTGLGYEPPLGSVRLPEASDAL